MKQPAETRLIFDRSCPGAQGCLLPEADVAAVAAPPDKFLRSAPLRLPEVPEWEVVRHYVGLSQRNYAVDVGTYPLGSCTMKYNPKVHEAIAALPGFASLHPHQPEETLQGALRLLRELEDFLKEISGMDAVSLQPPAGAQGEFTALLGFQAYHAKRGERGRRRVIVPDSSHGTNPASAARCGYSITTIASDQHGLTDLRALDAALGDDVAAFMLTNPNTLGLFEAEVEEICRRVHEAGALVYCDGANMNALLGIARPGDMGFDAMHFNTHKTFSTPHGGGGPGAGPIAVKAHLEPFLPVPRIREDNAGQVYLAWDEPESIGQVHGFYGNFGLLVRAYAYILSHGSQGLREVTERAVVNANYVQEGVRDHYTLPYGTEPDGSPRRCMHEFVLSADRQKALGCRAWDVGKRLIDYGIHPPTVYFPLIVNEAVMIEPTETETRASLDALIGALNAIARECEENPELVRSAPHNAAVGRVDEVLAARQLDVRWRFPNDPTGG